MTNPTNRNLLQKIQTIIAVSLKEKRLLKTLSHIFFQRFGIALSDILFDYKFGTETKIKVPLSKLNALGNNKSIGVDYSPTNYFLLKRIFKKLNCKFTKSNFVDFGAGKGRAMLLASQHDFKKIKGIEFSPELCEIGKKNVATYLARTKKNVDFEFIHMDATNYQLEDNDDVLFFYNPFGREVMETVLDNIESSLERKNRAIYIIYVYPKYSEIFCKRFKKIFTLNQNFVETHIFKNE